jgi:D-proline reductase (dithiol) PrdB
MADRDVKAMTADIETPVFETTAFTTPPPLDQATVAIVTTASLHHADQDDFTPGDTGFRVLDGTRRDLMTGHWSPNFDTIGFAADMNVVFPLDRLDELAAAGTIGRVADEHLSYAGNQFDLSAVRVDSGPAGAHRLRQQGVDVVLLTPV